MIKVVFTLAEVTRVRRGRPRHLGRLNEQERFRERIHRGTLTRAAAR